MWRQADDLRRKGAEKRREADALMRAAERLDRMAAAVADGRDKDIVEAALSVGHP